MTIDDYMTLPYETIIRADECDGEICFMAEHPQLFGCMAQGETPLKALESLKEARREYITAVLELGGSVAVPQYHQELREVKKGQTDSSENRYELSGSRYDLETLKAAA